MRRAKNVTAVSKGQIRCAIYTRKSSEEGLEQDFNSLDAQRESCEAFIRSQKHEGWVCLSEMYDDGGISGATMERPALKRLLADIEAERIDTVVVYKVDRLTRSLGDFAKIVEVFDRQAVSFVSVTQQFNTTTSMGRLTLNMLLSFAQFEREVTGERIRDKIAASKKKGMWMGGLPPLGYDVKDRKLVVNVREAETVRHIYRRYAALGSVLALKEELDGAGVVSKARVDKYGRRTGGGPLARGALYLMLQNRIYRGEIVHKENSYPGEHEAIIDQALWDEVQHQLAANRFDRATGAGATRVSLLAGLIYDDTGADFGEGDFQVAPPGMLRVGCVTECQVDAIKERGGAVLEAETQLRSDVKGQCAQMLMGGYEDVATAGRGVAKGRTGRPAREFSKEQLEAMQRIWFSRRYRTRNEAVVALQALGIRASSAWLYQKFGPPDRKAESPLDVVQLIPPSSPGLRKRTSLVYFIRDGSKVKIGHSVKPSVRMATLETHSKLELLAVCHGGRIREQALHKRFKEYRIKGEWFDLSPPIIKYIASLKRAKEK
jgi:DNA invertase Pin-like site-specific DNA recombinase